MGAFHNAFPAAGSTGYYLDVARFGVDSATRLVFYGCPRKRVGDARSCPRKVVGDASNKTLPEHCVRCHRYSGDEKEEQGAGGGHCVPNPIAVFASCAPRPFVAKDKRYALLLPSTQPLLPPTSRLEFCSLWLVVVKDGVTQKVGYSFSQEESSDPIGDQARSRSDLLLLHSRTLGLV